MKTIDVSQSLHDFDGKTELQAENGPLTLKLALLSQIRLAHTLPLPESDQSLLYAVGCRIATAEGPVEVPQAEYDALKRLTDKPPAAPLILTQQVKRMVDGAT